MAGSSSVASVARLSAGSPPAITPCTMSGRDAEGGRAFGSVQHAQTPAGSGADVEQAPAPPERGHDGIHRAGDGRDFARDRFRHFAVLGVDDAQHVFGRERVDRSRGGIGLFGEQVLKHGTGRNHPSG